MNKLIIFLSAAMLLASPIAGAESKYPAADFQPKVVYQDTNYKPAQSSTRSSVKDSKYPAANFEPTVVYQDKNYKPSRSTSASASVKRVAAATTGTESASATADKKDDSSNNLLIGIVVLALAGFFLYKKGLAPKTNRPAPRRKVQTRAPVISGEAEGATGVARYLSKNMPSLTGVAKYLQNQNASPTTGVAKYVAKKVISAKQEAASKVTGVEKYLRDRG